MSYVTHVEIKQRIPPEVKRIIGYGGGCWVGEVDDRTVLKYPHTDNEMDWVRIEAKILDILGCHSRIVQSKGLTENGLLLEFATNGNLHDYVTARPEVSLEQRLTWCTQATEAVAYIHSKRVLHCDIRHDNFLLDSNLDLKLADFQGQYFSPNGEVMLDGLSLESTKAYLPRQPADHASVKTDLFALGSSIYFIMLGHEVYPDQDASKDESEIERRFREGEFPTDPHTCATITAKCWRQLYTSAEQVLTDLKAVSEVIYRGGTSESMTNDLRINGESPRSPSAPWLSGLCDSQLAPKVPPPFRRLVGFEKEPSAEW